MSLLDYVILGLILAAAVFAIVRISRKGGSCGCSGQCERCARACTRADSGSERQR